MLRVLDNLQLSAAETGDHEILIYLTPIPAAVKDRLDTIGLIREASFLSLRSPGPGAETRNEAGAADGIPASGGNFVDGQLMVIVI